MQAAPVADRTPTPAPDGLPAPLPPAPASVAFSTRNWQPTAQDTCPKALHDRYAVIGPDGKLYPTWHPPTVIDPATGRTCTFGHEHGRDPRGSKLFDWVAQHFAAPGEEAYAGIPFGAATEALDDYANAHPGTAKRSEDHVGYKIDYANDVPLTTADGATGVTCDYLVRVHQGSHSRRRALQQRARAALRRPLHGRHRDHQQHRRPLRRARAVRAQLRRLHGHDDRQRLPERHRARARSPTAPACSRRSSSRRAAPPRPGRRTSSGARRSQLTTADNHVLASYDTGFGVFNPSRYGDGATARRTLDAVLGDRGQRRPRQRSGVRRRRTDAVRVRRRPLAVQRHPARPLPARHDARERRRPTALVDRSVRRQRLNHAVPGRRLPARRHRATPHRADVQEQVFGRGYSFDAPGVHSPN